MHRLILAQIEEWYQTICRTSKYKDDFGYIRDMHRLLSNKGYVFPEVKVEDAAVLNPSDNLKSLEELQKEEAIVHSAKLQELIRRGRPEDLQAANKLMKIMAGFKDDNVQENKRQIHDDIARLKRKTEILAEMLNNIQASGQEITDSNEAVVELYSSIKSSQPIVTKIIEEDNDNEEQVQDLLGLNDTINQLVTKFQLLKSGDVSGAQQINVASAPSGGANLIDFDDDEADNIANDQGYNDLLSDLSNLAFTNSTNQTASTSANDDLANLFGSGGSIALGGSTLQQPTPQQPQSQPQAAGLGLDLLGDLNSPSPQLQSNTSLDPFGLSFPASTPASVAQKTIDVSQSASLKIEVSVFSVSPQQFEGKALFSNLGTSTISGLKFLLAVPKSCKLILKPQLGDVLYALSNHGVLQDFSIENPQQKSLKIKWKVEYILNGQPTTETGVSVLA